MGIPIVRYRYEQKVAWGVVQQELVFPVDIQCTTLRELLQVGQEVIQHQIVLLFSSTT